MKSTKYTFDEAPKFTPVFPINTETEALPSEYNTLKNQPLNLQVFAYDVASVSWSAWDATARVVNIIGSNTDRGTSYSQEIITSLGSTTANITRSGNIQISNNSFILPSGGVLEVIWRFTTATQNLEIRLTWSSSRFLQGSSSTMTSTNDKIAFINSWTTNIVVDMRFSTSAAERPNFGVFFKIY